MARCCPPPPTPETIGAVAAEAGGPESDLRPGETVECYMARGGNTSGLHDDATQNVLNKIENTSIPISQGPTRFAGVQFTLTEGSDRVPTNWSWANNGGENLSSLGVSLSSSGLLTGNIDPAAFGKVFKVTVTAADGAGTIDTRGFTFAPSEAGDDALQLISPLPGAVVNSKFGPRLHPIQQVMKPHTGIDMKYLDRSVKDVVAAADGQVALAGGDRSSGYGLRVWIKHRTSSGQDLCTTTYNHLEKIYVKNGQKVMAGQAIGLEGSTGASTGPHLHFECRLPDGKFIDPEPLIRGELLVARSTTLAGDPVNPSPRTSSASLTASEAAARSSSCAPFGPSYPPADPPETDDPPPAPTPTEPFELAWFFTMTHEVGPFWTDTLAGTPDVAAGLIETAIQRRNVGYVNTANFPGGETKFGVAQKPNPSISVRAIDYAGAKRLGFNNYWKGAPITCVGKGAYLAIMLFDLNYLHGGGNARKIWNDAVAGGMNEAASSQADQLLACEVLTDARVQFIEQITQPAYQRGWLKRARDTLAYVRSLPSGL